MDTFWINLHPLLLCCYARQICVWLENFLFAVVVFPQDLLEKGLAANNFAMLGLGDIVIPGIFIALLLRFDVRWAEFYSSYVWYVAFNHLLFWSDSMLCSVPKGEL